MDGSVGLGAKKLWLAKHTVNQNEAIQLGSAISFLGNRTISGKISAHPYNESAMFLIEETERSGGMALDCGAGFRTFTSENLVQTEIMPYPNIDVLCDAQTLPFVDGCFDLVMSFDVLEHVPDPYAAARELMRVLKPGGTLLIDIPFLQVEHGYPHHYTNFTRAGMRRLFEPLRCNAHVVPASGHASHVVHTALHTFKAGIAKKDRERFLSMTVGEILNASHKELRSMFIEGFDEEISWKMASSTQAIFTKPGDDSLVRYELTDLPQFRSAPVGQLEASY